MRCWGAPCPAPFARVLDRLRQARDWTELWLVGDRASEAEEHEHWRVEDRPDLYDAAAALHDLVTIARDPEEDRRLRLLAAEGLTDGCSGEAIRLDLLVVLAVPEALSYVGGYYLATTRAPERRGVPQHRDAVSIVLARRPGGDGG